MSIAGDDVVGLLGRSLIDPDVDHFLRASGVPWRPVIGRDRLRDWIMVGTVEIGFEDAGSFAALPPTPGAPPVVEQVVFYVNRAPDRESADPTVLPFGLGAAFDRQAVRQRLAPLAGAARRGRRDAFDIGTYTVVADFVAGTGLLDGVLVLARRGERPSALPPDIDAAQLERWIGTPWHDRDLRDRLYAHARSAEAVRQIKRHGNFDFVREGGIKLLFRRAGTEWLVAGFTIHRARVHDAATWLGGLPLQLGFDDSIESIEARLGAAPVWRKDKNLESHAIWRLGAFQLVVTFDSIVNLVATIAFGHRDYWEDDDR